MSHPELLLLLPLLGLLVAVVWEWMWAMRAPPASPTSTPKPQRNAEGAEV